MKVSTEEWEAWLNECNNDKIYEDLATSIFDNDEQQFNLELLDVCLYASGDDRYKYRALRFLLSRFGRSNTIRICGVAAKSSYHSYRIIIRERRLSEMPDKGRWKRSYKHDQLCMQLGLKVYDEMSSGKSKIDAIELAKNQLSLNLSNDSIEKKLKHFKELVKNRGFIPNTTFASFLGLNMPHDSISLKSLSKRGRPKNR